MTDPTFPPGFTPVGCDPNEPTTPTPVMRLVGRWARLCYRLARAGQDAHDQFSAWTADQTHLHQAALSGLTPTETDRLTDAVKDTTR